MSTPNIPAGAINAWIYLDEDDPSTTGYTTPNSSYQSLVNNKVYQSTDFVNVCFFITLQSGNYYTMQIGNASTVHPDGSTTAEYLAYTIRDARAQNPDVKILATFNYGTISKTSTETFLSQIFSGPEAGWQLRSIRDAVPGAPQSVRPVRRIFLHHAFTGGQRKPRREYGKYLLRLHQCAAVFRLYNGG